MGGNSSNSNPSNIKPWQAPTGKNTSIGKKAMKEKMREMYGKDGADWYIGQKAWSQILNGPYNGTWIEVFVTKIHPGMKKIDLRIPDYKKFRVYSTAVEVPTEYIRRDDPSGSGEKGEPEFPPPPDTAWKVGMKGFSRILSGRHKGTWIGVIIKQVHHDRQKLDVFIPEHHKYKVYAKAMDVPTNTIYPEVPKEITKSTEPKIEIEPSINAIVQVILSINKSGDPHAPPNLVMLQTLFKAIDQDKDKILNDKELGNMLLAISMAWKQELVDEAGEVLKDEVGEDVKTEAWDNIVSYLDKRIVNTKENISENVEEVKMRLDIDRDGKVSINDFMMAAPSVLFSTVGTEV